MRLAQTSVTELDRALLMFRLQRAIDEGRDEEARELMMRWRETTTARIEFGNTSRRGTR